MPELKIALIIPIPVDRGVSAPGLTFSRWLPLDDKDAILVTEGDVSVALRFQIESTWWAHNPSIEELPGIVNVLAHRLYADVTVVDVRNELLTYLQRRDFRHRAATEDVDVQAKCDALSERVLVLTLRTVNRLISYARSRKAQYWLSEYEIDVGRCSETFARFEAKARFADTGWFRFGPSNVTSVPVVLAPEERFIRSDEWPEIRDFVASSGRTPLARTLLAGAETLAANGHSRSALTEAVTALEVALYAFARHPAADRAFGAGLASRLDLASLLQQVEHLGFSGSVRYLLPTLLPANVLPQAVIEGCRSAISQRQTVVHQGQREVPDGTLRASLAAIRSLCDILESLTQSAEDDAAGHAAAV
jgi:hypothetical protein